MQKETEVFLSSLKELYNEDPHAIDCLVSTRVPYVGDTNVCGKEITLRGFQANRVGLLGILNYILEKLNGDKIAAVVDENDSVVDFSIYTNPDKQTS